MRRMLLALVGILVIPLTASAHKAAPPAFVDSGARMVDSPYVNIGRVPNVVTVTVIPKGCHEATCERVQSQHNARVDSGASFVSNQISGTVAAVAKYIAVSADVTAVAKADTTCPSEITTGGLARAVATYGGYTPPGSLGGTASYTLSLTYNATAAYTIAKLCLLNATSGGTLLFETLLGTAVTGGSGDTLNVVWTVQD